MSLQDVLTFHEKADLQIDKELTGHVLKQRGLPMLEELREVQEAFWLLQNSLRRGEPQQVREAYLMELLKEMMDVRYTISSLLIALGINEELAFSKVCKSNLSKLAAGVFKNDDGKVLKGSLYQPPTLDPEELRRPLTPSVAGGSKGGVTEEEIRQAVVGTGDPYDIEGSIGTMHSKRVTALVQRVLETIRGSHAEV